MRIRAEIDALERGLRAAGRPERAQGEKRYLKSDFDFLGTSAPEVRRQVKGWLAAHAPLTHDELTRLARALFRRRINELKVAAIVLLQSRSSLLVASDIDLLEQMIRTSYTWAYVDALAIHVAGPLFERHQELAPRLDAWSKDADFWVRRSALLALLLPLRRGDGDWPRFARYAEAMLGEKEFFVRKAIGWVLRETAKKNPEVVQSFVAGAIREISDVTLREAVKYLDPVVRNRLLAQYRARARGG